MYESVISQYLAMMERLLTKRSYNFAEASSKDVPERPRVYVIYDKRVEVIIYAGRTKNLRRCLLGDHKRGNIEGSQFRRALKTEFSFKI